MEAIAQGQEGVRERYRRLRAINERHTAAAFESMPRQWLRDWCKRLGLFSQRRVGLATEGEKVLSAELALYSGWMGMTPFIQRYRKKIAVPEGSDEAALLDAMCGPRFCILSIENRHPVAGFLVKDLLTNQDLWLMDESMERTVTDRPGFAARLIDAGEFHMTTGSVVPLETALIAQVLLKYPNLLDGLHPEWSDNARFILNFYRSAIDSGAMQDVRYE
jgi:hypothetical protein